MDIKQLTDLLEKPIFVTDELRFPLSIQSVANKRYSDAVISSVFRMKPELDFNYNKQKLNEQSSEKHDKPQASKEKILTFCKSEIYFDDRKSVMINMRDITHLENMHEAVHNNKLHQRIYDSMAPDLISPFLSIGYICDAVIESGPTMDQAELRKSCASIKRVAQLASYRTKNFIDIKAIQAKEFYSTQSVFNPIDVVNDIISLTEH